PWFLKRLLMFRTSFLEIPAAGVTLILSDRCGWALTTLRKLGSGGSRASSFSFPDRNQVAPPRSPAPMAQILLIDGSGATRHSAATTASAAACVLSLADAAAKESF